jgi:hypothetical protein
LNQPENIHLRDVPLVKMSEEFPIKRIHKSAITIAIYVVRDVYFETQMLTLFRPGMAWIYRIK